MELRNAEILSVSRPVPMACSIYFESSRSRIEPYAKLEIFSPLSFLHREGKREGREERKRTCSFSMGILSVVSQYGKKEKM